MEQNNSSSGRNKYKEGIYLVIKYVALLCARNEEKDVGDCLKSMLEQSVPPIEVVVVIDGSTDKTKRIVAEHKQLWRHKIEITLVKRQDRGFSALGTYLMADVYNDGFKVINTIKGWDFIFIGSSANRYPYNYVENLSKKMDGYGVGSGLATDAHLVRTHPAGSGRLIRREVMEALGGYYPRRYDWEGTTERMSLYMGLKSGNFPEVPFIRTRHQDRYHKRNHKGWGFAMKEVGYLPVIVLVRSLKMIIKEQRIKQAFAMIVGYFAYRIDELPVYNVQVRELQRQRVADVTRKMLRKVKIY